MAIVSGDTRTGLRPTTPAANVPADADFSAYKIVTLAATNSPDDNAIPYLLSTTADQVPYAVLGNKDGNPDGKRDTLIVGGVVPVQINAAYADSMRGKGILTHTVKGIGKPGDNGMGVIVNGGTEVLTNRATGAQTTVNVAYVDLDRHISTDN